MTAKNEVKPSSVAQTVIPNEAPEPAKSVSLTSPWGSKVTIDADLADVFKDAGYQTSK